MRGVEQMNEICNYRWEVLRKQKVTRCHFITLVVSDRVELKREGITLIIIIPFFIILVSLFVHPPKEIKLLIRWMRKNHNDR